MASISFSRDAHGRLILALQGGRAETTAELSVLAYSGVCFGSLDSIADCKPFLALVSVAEHVIHALFIVGAGLALTDDLETFISRKESWVFTVKPHIAVSIVRAGLVLSFALAHATRAGVRQALGIFSAVVARESAGGLRRRLHFLASGHHHVLGKLADGAGAAHAALLGAVLHAEDVPLVDVVRVDISDCFLILPTNSIVFKLLVIRVEFRNISAEVLIANVLGGGSRHHGQKSAESEDSFKHNNYNFLLPIFSSMRFLSMKCIKLNITNYHWFTLLLEV